MQGSKQSHKLTASQREQIMLEVERYVKLKPLFDEVRPSVLARKYGVNQRAILHYVEKLEHPIKMSEIARIEEETR